MKLKPKQYWMILGLILIASSLILPMWKIVIWAPQYPEWLSMNIYASKITGNVDQINILNHYIGMAAIVPEEVPELQILPWVLSAIALLGLVFVFIKSLLWSRVWFFSSVLCGIIAFYDFYLWGYRYGHELSPDAPIKVPGLTYQPPLIGYKKILNIEAYSLPELGAYALGIGFLIAFFVLFDSVRDKTITPLKGFLKKITSKNLSSKKSVNVAIVIASLASLSIMGCKETVSPLQAGVDHCDHCHMKIMDTKFGGEAITKKGRIYKFDSISCLRSYLKNSKDKISNIYVADYLEKDSLVHVKDAKFLKTDSIPGPMGPDYIASKKFLELQKLDDKSQGLSWDDLKD